MPRTQFFFVFGCVALHFGWLSFDRNWHKKIGINGGDKNGTVHIVKRCNFLNRLKKPSNEAAAAAAVTNWKVQNNINNKWMVPSIQYICLPLEKRSIGNMSIIWLEVTYSLAWKLHTLCEMKFNDRTCASWRKARRKSCASKDREREKGREKECEKRVNQTKRNMVDGAKRVATHSLIN